MGVSKYPDELKERAVRMVKEARQADPKDQGAVNRIARQLGIRNGDSLRAWIRQADIDDGSRPGTTSSDAAKIKELEKENKELRRTNEILKAATSFFAQEVDSNRRK